MVIIGYLRLFKVIKGYFKFFWFVYECFFVVVLFMILEFESLESWNMMLCWVF